MKISACMTRDVRIADPAETLQEAARAMAELDAGFLPVGEGDRLIGVITDRDIVIRGVANGRASDTTVREVMSPDVRYCYADDSCVDILYNMADLQVRRLPVVDRDKRLVGIVSITDLATNGESSLAGEALTQIARPSEYHSQSV